MQRAKHLWAALLLANFAFAQTNQPESHEPDAQLIQMAYQSELTCTLADPPAVLAAVGVKELSNLVNDARSVSAKALQDYTITQGVSYEYLSLRALRLQKRFTLADAFTQHCQRRSSKSFRGALAQLRPADPAVIGELAWVPLISADREYFGAGLIFVREKGVWRYLYFQLEVLGLTTRTLPIIQALNYESAPEEEEDPGAFVALCPMPEAPEASKIAANSYEPEVAFDQIYEGEFDSKNALGAAQRLAVRRYAEGKQVPASAIAQLVFAEVLIRSLEFDNAPKAGTPIWLSRVQRAEQFFEQANIRGADLHRFAPLIAWLAELHSTGAGGVEVDISRATKLFQIALNAGVEDAAEKLLDLKTMGLASADQQAEVPGLPWPGRFEPVQSLPREAYRCE